MLAISDVTIRLPCGDSIFGTIFYAVIVVASFYTVHADISTDMWSVVCVCYKFPAISSRWKLLKLDDIAFDKDVTKIKRAAFFL